MTSTVVEKPEVLAVDRQLICGDCATELPKLNEQAQLVFADPPYNIGVDYGAGKKADFLPADEYLSWCREWMAHCRDALTPDGSLWVVICDEWAAHFALMLNEAGLHQRTWIKWYETFGVNCTNKFNRTSRHIFYYVKDPRRFVFNAEAVRRPSDRQTKYNDKRANPNGKILDNVWTVSRVCGTFHERIPALPTQIPLEITRRIVGCASNPGDLVVEPFCGGAPAGVAAGESGRQYVGIDTNPEYIAIATARLK